MLLQVVFAAVLTFGSCVAHVLNNVDSLRVQNENRAIGVGSLIDNILVGLTVEETNFITKNLNELSSFNGTSCQKCHNKMKFAKKSFEKYPEKSHLIALMLYEYCLVLKKGKESACQFSDFFIFTNGKNSVKKSAESGPVNSIKSSGSIDFYDNDFIQLVKNMNVSSKLTLDYYCYYKGSYCPLPDTPDMSSIYNLDALWPAKTAKLEAEPAYNASRETFNVLHLSDFHNQIRYQVGSEANCSQGLCCLPESYNSALTSSSYNFTSVYTKAGASSVQNLSYYEGSHYSHYNVFVKGKYQDLGGERGWNYAWTPASSFGNYQCDTPEILLNNSLAHIGDSHSLKNFEFTVFTGDIVDHDVVHTDAKVTKDAEIRSYKIMKHFLKELPIYPTLANHDTFPYGQLAPQHINNVTFDESTYHWNEREMVDLWIRNGWFKKGDRYNLTHHYAGFATTTSRGLKVISLNSNCYYQKNLYSYIDVENQPDLFGQWQFLIDELVESESKGQRVWIMAHIPAGDFDALPIQSTIFAKIVERFSPYTIANIFFGHTHKDQFKILHNNASQPVNMAWISQAITPLGPANPSWRYYEVEDESFNIINAYNYYTPLNETWVNGGQEPRWNFEYSPRDTYDSTGQWPKTAPLNATFWDEFVLQRLSNKSDVSFHQKYTNLMYRLNPYVPSCKNNTANSTDITSRCYADNYCYNVAFKIDTYYDCTT